MTAGGAGPPVTVRYWAAAKEAAGTAEERFTGPATLAEVLAAARSARAGGDGRLDQVLRRCSFLVDGVPAGRRDPAEVPVPPGAVVEVLPPFAGG